MQAGLEGTSFQIPCPRAGPSRDHEPSVCMGLISILFQPSIRLHHPITNAIDSTQSPSWAHVGSPRWPRLWSHLLSGDVCLGIMPLLCEDDVEHGMGAAAGLIHVGGSHRAAGRGGQGGMRPCRGHWSDWHWGRAHFRTGYMMGRQVWRTREDSGRRCTKVQASSCCPQHVLRAGKR